MSPRPLVLVADDDPDILLLMTLTLERDGYDVVAAKDGLSALQTAVERVPRIDGRPIHNTGTFLLLSAAIVSSIRLV